MKIPYSAGIDSSLERYIQNIKDLELDIVVDERAEEIFKKFYHFVKHTVQKKYLYKEKTQTLVKEMKKSFERQRFYILESNTGLANISYYKMKKSSIDRKYLLGLKTKRITKFVLELTAALDLQRFGSSAGPNLAHFEDADEIREIELSLNKYYITVHDCYLVDFLGCTQLIQARQAHYQKYIRKHIPNATVTNIFILL